MHFLLTLIVQIAVILVAARIVGLLFRKIHQPQVVGEMVAGILLGPSVLGWLAPGLSVAIFPQESLVHLNVLSQVGLLLFMFLVGLELDPRLLRGRGHAAIVISHVSIVAPFLLGAVLALYLYPRLSYDTVSFTGFALFMGAAMSVTAFPVLARILTERNLLRTKVGAVTIACAAVDDVTAWCILAVVVAVVREGEAHLPFWATLAGSGTFILLMLFVVRPMLQRVHVYYQSRGNVTQDLTAGILVVLLASAWTTEWLGIHALFGAFLAGSVMPKESRFVRDLTEKFEHVTVVFLLPLFFAFTGLRTSIGLVEGGEMWFYCGLILFTAVLGKFGGSTISAKLTALSWREAGALGILMNTRGLMELVILTIGLDLGVISPTLFTMMVIMALVTTFMTTPVLAWIYPARLLHREYLSEAAEPGRYAVMIPVSLPSSGPGLLRVARAVSPVPDPQFYALHLVRSSDGLITGNIADDAKVRADKALQPLLSAAADSGVAVSPFFFVSRDAAKDITDIAYLKGAGLILMGWHKPVVSRSVLSGMVNDVMRQAQMDVAVYLERQFGLWRRVLVPYIDGVHDRAAIAMAVNIARHSDADVTVLHVVSPVGDGGQLGIPSRPDALDSDRVHLRTVEHQQPLEEVIRVAREGHDLIVVGISETWGLEPSLFSNRHERLARECPGSLLMVRAHANSTAGAQPPAWADTSPDRVAIMSETGGPRVRRNR